MWKGTRNEDASWHENVETANNIFICRLCVVVVDQYLSFYASEVCFCFEFETLSGHGHETLFRAWPCWFTFNLTNEDQVNRLAHDTFRSIHLHFFKNLSRFLLCWLRLIHGSCLGPQNRIGHPVGCRFLC